MPAERGTVCGALGRGAGDELGQEGRDRDGVVAKLRICCLPPKSRWDAEFHESQSDYSEESRDCPCFPKSSAVLGLGCKALPSASLFLIYLGSFLGSPAHRVTLTILLPALSALPRHLPLHSLSVLKGTSL